MQTFKLGKFNTEKNIRNMLVMFGIDDKICTPRSRCFQEGSDNPEVFTPWRVTLTDIITGKRGFWETPARGEASQVTRVLHSQRDFDVSPD